ncbi:ribose-phosphate pyrophosphokinase [Candidatus Woesearchaeota archaeon]|nr:ribose-phosphate pyrophosphokinase [Candidatus Woesearchaeota archaeon]
MRKLKLFTGSVNNELAEKISMRLGVPLSPLEIKRFKDTETYVKIKEKVRGEDVFIIQSTSPPVNENLMELLIILDAMKRSSAGRINVVIPYYGYGRQDRKATAREPITAKLVANLITAAGADRVVTVDLHTDQIQGFFDIPVDHFVAYPLFADYFKDKKIKNIVAVAPDTGFAKKTRRFAKLMEIPMAIIDKRRPAHNRAEVCFVIGDVKNKTAILIDDIIDTGGTISAAADALIQKGADKVYICATHAVLSGDAVKKLEVCKAKEIILTDTIPLASNKVLKKMKIISVASLMAQVIERIHSNESLGKLFYWEALV